MLPQGLKFVLANLGLTVIYFIAAKFGLTLAFVHTSASAVWPPTGIAIAAVLLLGYRVAPGILLGAFLANATTDGNLATAAAIAVGNTLEALAACWLVNHFAAGRHVFERPATIFRYVALVSLGATTISASIGPLSLVLGRFAEWENYHWIWLTWWLGDTASAIIVAPVIVIWSQHRWTLPGVARLAEALALMCVAVAVGAIVFTRFSPWNLETYPLGFLCIPPLIWASCRFSLLGAVTAALLIEILAIWGTREGYGAFALSDPNDSMLLLQSFMGAVFLTSLLLAAAVSEQKRTAGELADHRDHLQELVALRTRDLEASHVRLRLAERMSALGTLAAGLGHDLGNLLVPIRMKLEILQQSDLSEAERLECLEGLNASADYLQRLVSGLRTMASDPLRAAEADGVELHKWWQEAQPLLKGALPKGIELRCEIADGECEVAMSKPALTQAVFNLVQNAGDAMRSRGWGTVTVWSRGGRNGQAAPVEVGVRDDGPGMTADVQRQCIEPYFTTKEHAASSGLGLSLVYGLVSNAGGSLAIDSETGRGTSVTLLLGEAQPASRGCRSAVSPGAVPSSGP